MRTFLYRTSFKSRVWFSTMLITFVSIIVTGYASHYIATGQLEKKAAELGQLMIDKSAMALQEKLRKVRLAAVTFMISEPFENILRHKPSGEPERSYYAYFALNDDLQTPLMQMKMIEPSIDTILVHTAYGEYYLLGYARRSGTPFEETALYEQMESNLLPHWSLTHEDRLFEGKARVLSLLMEPISTPNTSEVQVIVNVKEEAIQQYVETNMAGGGGHILVLNADGELVMNLDSPLAGLVQDAEFLTLLNKGERPFDFSFGRQSYLVNHASISFPDNWRVVYLQPRDVLLKDIQYINWAVVIIICMLIPVVFLLTQWVTSRLILPLHKLQRLMARAGDHDLSVRYETSYKDEVAQVGGRFNTMLEKIERLIEDVKTAEHLKRIYEMKVLQSQINPHFLYNTLNTILWKAESREQEDVKEMIVSLSLLFRLGLNNGHELTTVAKEVDHVTQYLMLQHQCYEELFDYRIDVEEHGLLELPCLKLLLQPLVENSIIHGFKNGDRMGWIHVRIYRERHWIVFAVQDNGAGFDSGALMRSVIDDADAEGFALKNVYRRMKLYYGEDAKVELESEPMVRTTVRLFWPIAGQLDDGSK